MAEDFGDYTGEKLVDWMVDVGRVSGEAAAQDAADRLRSALRNIKSQAGDPAVLGSERSVERDGRKWALLDMHEFADLPEWESLKPVLSAKLSDCGIEHGWHTGAAGTEQLLFKVADAPVLVRAVDELIEDVDHAQGEVARRLAKTRDTARKITVEKNQERKVDAPAKEASDKRLVGSLSERLADRVERVRSAAAEINRHGEPSRELEVDIDRERTR